MAFEDADAAGFVADGEVVARVIKLDGGDKIV